MSEHYYSKKPQTESKPKSWNFTLRGETVSILKRIQVF